MHPIIEAGIMKARTRPARMMKPFRAVRASDG
jgi:hypothetical protein